jgi:hypothetical protein
LIKLQKTPHGWMPHGDSLPAGLPCGPVRSLLAAPVQ